MNAERWERTKEILDEVLRLAPMERRVYLDRACGTDVELRSEVESLLSSHHQAGTDFLAAAAPQVLGFTETVNVPAAELNRRLGHYRLLEELGRGGMGIVYKAEDTRLHRYVALKFLPERVSQDPQALARLRREAEAAAALNHPNICTLYDIGEADGRTYIALEYLQGATLNRLIGHRPLELEQLLKIGSAIADALQTAHAKGVVHRDIKPANVFVTDSGLAKILDFGVAKLAPTLQSHTLSAQVATAAQLAPELLTSPGLALGTVAYMSPEQVLGKELDSRSDLFSLGIVLYEMATGALPFTGPTSGAIFDAILHTAPVAPVKINPDLPRELERIINKCLEKDADLRYQGASEIRTDLKRLQRDSESKKFVSPTGPSPLKWTSRATWTAGVVAALTVALLVIVFFARERISGPKPMTSNFQKMEVVNLTDNGNVEVAALSPDGRHIAYSLKNAQQRSVWVRQVATESAVQVVSPRPGRFSAITFSPDADFLYLVKEHADTKDAYVVPALGGVARLIITNLETGIGVSPDGKKLAFVRAVSLDKSQLFVANSDGTDEHVVVDAVEAKSGRFYSPAAPSWSPDGSLIALPIITATGTGIFFHNFSTAQNRILPSTQWIASASWVPDQSGLVITAAHLLNEKYQIWLQPFPNGQPQRISNDLNNYLSVSVAQTDQQFVTVKVESHSTMMIASSSTPDAGVPLPTRQADGIGLTWLPDGRLLSQDESSRFWLLSADGKERNLAFEGLGDIQNGDFEICGNGSNYVVLSRGSGDNKNIWRVDIDGRNLRQLTNGDTDDIVSCSPDGASIIFRSQSGTRVVKAPINGGSPAKLFEATAVTARYSPDGRYIGILAYEGELSESHAKLVLFDSANNKIVRTFRLPPGNWVVNSQAWSLRWTPDGQALTCARQQGSTVNLWKQPIAGGAPQQITHFPDAIAAYAWSPDGKRLAVTRQTRSRDVVLFRNFR